MRKYWKYQLMPIFLDSVKDCTFVELDNIDLTKVLEGIIKLSIEDFLFPKVSLKYAYDESTDPLDEEEYGYYFIDESVDFAEFKVIIAWMKVYWVQMQLNNKANFQNPLFDKDIKGYSPAAMLKTIESVFITTKEEAKSATSKYSRKNEEGEPSWGKIHGSN